MKKTNKNFNLDYVKANRKGNRDAELKMCTGFISKHKVHKSKKNYTRKTKHKAKSIDFAFSF